MAALDDDAFDCEYDDNFPDGWEDCDACGGDGVVGHDCGEDTCPCADPVENVTCNVCDGKGGWEQP